MRIFSPSSTVSDLLYIRSASSISAIWEIPKRTVLPFPSLLKQQGMTTTAASVIAIREALR